MSLNQKRIDQCCSLVIKRQPITVNLFSLFPFVPILLTTHVNIIVGIDG